MDIVKYWVTLVMILLNIKKSELNFRVLDRNVVLLVMFSLLHLYLTVFRNQILKLKGIKYLNIFKH